MVTPDFLIVGAQKCGTTWLHHHLRMIPQVFMPQDKDAPLFFNDAQEAETYCRRFDTALPGQLIGDACAGFFWTRQQAPIRPDLIRIFRVPYIDI